MKILFFTLFFSAVGASVVDAGTFNRQSAGQIEGARLAYVSSSVVAIGTGFGEIQGSYWEIGPSDPLISTGYTLTGLSATTSGEVEYIYIDGVNSPLPSVLIKNSLTAPAWSDTYRGWYNGSDRCIGAVWITAAGSINSFYCPDDRTYVWHSDIVFTPGSIDTTTNNWHLYDISSFVPVNANEVASAITIWENSGVNWSFSQVGISAGTDGDPCYGTGVTFASIHEYLQYKRSDAQKVQWMAYASSSNGTIQLTVRGYRLER